jgi:hypothetical protein
VLIICILSALYLWYAHPLKISFTLSFFLLVYLYLVAIIDLERHLVLRSLSITGLCLTTLAGSILHGWITTLLGGLAGFVIIFITYLFGMLLNRLSTRYLALSLEEAGDMLATGDIALAIILGLLMG